MPPERTSSSFLEAAQSGAPLSSHGKGHAASIARGQACLVCRKRKLKCDGVKPLCGACKKSAQAHGDDITSIACEYNDANAPKKKRASPGSKVAALEAEIAELKALTQTGVAAPPAPPAFLPSGPSAASSSTPSPSGGLTPPVVEYTNYLPQPPPTAPSGAYGIHLPSPPFQPWIAPHPHHSNECEERHGWKPAVDTSAPWYPPPVVDSSPRINPNIDLKMSPSADDGTRLCGFAQTPPQISPSFTPLTTSSGSSPASSVDPFRELLYPGWPNDLPSPELTMRLVEVWLSRPHITQGMINPVKFRNSMLLPPTSQGFPHRGLLHMICALASMMVHESFFGDEVYWDAGLTPSEYHAGRAKACLDSSIADGKQLFQVAQTVTLLCFWAYSMARFVELWLYVGQATRILTPLGLNHLRSSSDPNGASKGFKPYLLPPTSDPEELRERAMTFYFAIMGDRFASGSTGWATSLDDGDFTTLLPTENLDYPTTNLDESPISPRSSMFMLAHPPDSCGPLQLMLKAILLYGRVSCFTQRAPHQSFPGKTTNVWGLNDPVQDVRETDAFRRLDATVQAFRASIPREYQLTSFIPGSGAFDIVAETRLCLLHGLTHTSNILLHEPWVNSIDEEEPSMKKCAESARAILQAVFILLSSSYEITLYSPYINMVWAIAGRTFVRELAIKTVKGETEGVDELRGHIDTLLLALKAYKTPLGAASAAQLQFLVDDPIRTLPTAFVFPNMSRDQHPSLLSAPHLASEREAFLARARESHSHPTDCPLMLRYGANLAAETSPPGEGLAYMNGGKAYGSSLSGVVEGVANATQPFMAGMGGIHGAAWRDKEKRKQAESERAAREMTESIAAAVKSVGMEGSGASPPRFEELSGAEMTGLETLLGL